MIADTWRTRRGVECTAANVVVTPGAKPILLFAMVALLDTGDEVLIPSPAFPNYASIAALIGAKVVPVPLLPAKGFDIDLDALRARITPRTRLLVLNSPHNPTGGVIPPATLAAIAELARQHDFVVLADEIYAGMVYDGESPSMATFPGMAERTVVVDGFSKTYAMTGWRLGFGIMPEPLAKHMAALMNNSNSCTATFVQKAGEAALLGPQGEVAAMVAEFRVRRDQVIAGLNAIPGVTCAMPPGAFYAFPRVDVPGMTSGQLADRLLDEAGVVTLPGTAFGAEGEGYLRLSYANSQEQLAEGLRRIASFIGTVR